MFKILEKRQLTPDITLMRIHAPRVAAAAKPGQFIIVRVDEKGERIPLTIADYNPTEGSVTIVIQAIGVSTKKLCTYNEGDSICDFAGPLGHPSEFVNESIDTLSSKRILFVAGGVGAAPVYPQVKWLAERGIKADVIIGAKNAETLIMTDEMRAVAGNLYIATDDGSAGYKGLVTGLMSELIEKEGKQYDQVVAIGPLIMMKFVALTAGKYNLPIIVSMNPVMVDGTGMCGACRITVDGKTRFACVEGPEFDGSKVDFDEAMRRSRMYRDLEERAKKIAEERAAGHKCKIGLDK